MLTTKDIVFETSTINDGNMSFRFGNETDVMRNRQAWLNKNGLAWEKHVCMRCNHGEYIVSVNNDTNLDEFRMIDAEVLVTQEPNLTLALLTADCLPTAFYDPVTKTIALSHFSRETIANGLPQKTIGFLRRTYNVDPADLQVYVGPYIHKESYSFTPPLKLVKELIAPFVEIKNNKALIDLIAAHNYQLTELGVKLENIEASEVDTLTSSDHFSHFESTKYSTKPRGRIATVLTLKS